MNGLHSVSLFSDNAGRLAVFYRDVVGLKTTFEGDCPVGGEGERAFDFSLPDGTCLYVVDHSEIHGKNLHSARIIFNFRVEGLDTEVERLSRAGAKKVNGPYALEGFGRIVTFEDPDANYFQLIELAAAGASSHG